MTRTPRVAIIGAGMSGLCLGAQLQRAGIDTFTLYEKADRVGGTWRENTYPGIACDVPSLNYQFSFAPNPDWSHLLSPGAEIQAYFEKVARDEGLVPHIRFGTELTRSAYVEGQWHLFSGDERVDVVDFLVSAAGILHHPRYPDLDGLEDFAGAAFHSARWDHSVPLEGRRIGVVGTGSPGAQIIAALAPDVEYLTVFQRTPQWVLPIHNPAVTGRARRLLAKMPGTSALTRAVMDQFLGVFIEAVTHEGWQRRFVNIWTRRNLASVKDPELRAKLTPDFEPLCRRMIISSGYYDALQRENVAVVTEDIERVVPEGVVTGDGVLHELDVLVLATGFDAHAYVRPMALVGVDGVTLDEAWADGPRAYATVAQPGFPNYFTVMGPHSPVGNFSLTTIAENQVGYILQWIEEWRAGRVDAIEPTAEATARFNAEVRAAAVKTIWASGCTGWYLGPDGVPELWPWHPSKHQELLRKPEPADFVL